MSKIIPPAFKEKSFNCPHCNAYSHQIWKNVQNGSNRVNEMNLVYCSHCEKYSIWLHQKMIYPDISSIQPPNQDLDQDIIDDYLEAVSIVNKSPRGAVALLRLSIQKLCKQLGEDGKNINKNIASLVEKGLPPTIQKALDIVRVVGNDAVHPGTIDLKDNQEVANKLFELINIIATVMITQPKEIATLYETLPEEKKEAISTRDS